MKVGGRKTRTVFERYAIAAQSHIADTLGFESRELGMILDTMLRRAPNVKGPRLDQTDCVFWMLFMVARDGIEPPTRGFSVRCSTS